MFMKLGKLLFLFVIGIGFWVEAIEAGNTTGLPELNIPSNNPQSAEKILLGKLLFNDQRFSADGTVSCASCHQKQKAFTDGLPKAKGINGQIGTRNTPTVLNAAYFQQFFHDGRAPSLEQQALGPFINPIEHGLENHDLIVSVVRNDPGYIKQFKQVFQLDQNAISIDAVVKAIAAYERTLLSADSDFDRYYFAGDKTAMSESAARGLRIFRRKGNCANCHEISWNNAFFSDNRYYNIGVGFNQLQPVINDLINSLKQDANAELSGLTKAQHSELGRFNVTHRINDIGKFKTPTLRNIALTGPYMHDGSMSSLEEVIEYYDQGGEKNPFLDPAIFPLKLTKQEKTDLLAFLLTLTGTLPK